jgi:hypothetical protein
VWLVVDPVVALGILDVGGWVNAAWVIGEIDDPITIILDIVVADPQRYAFRQVVTIDAHRAEEISLSEFTKRGCVFGCRPQKRRRRGIFR